MPDWSRGRVQTENTPAPLPVPVGSRLSLGPITPSCKKSTDYGNLQGPVSLRGKRTTEDDDDELKMIITIKIFHSSIIAVGWVCFTNRVIGLLKSKRGTVGLEIVGRLYCNCLAIVVLLSLGMAMFVRNVNHFANSVRQNLLAKQGKILYG